MIPRWDTRARFPLKLVASAVHQARLAASRRRGHGPRMLAASVLGQHRGINGGSDASNAALSGVTPTAETGMLSRIGADAAGRTGRPSSEPAQETETQDAVLPPLEPDATPLDEPVPEAMAPLADERMSGMDEEAAGMQDATGRGMQPRATGRPRSYSERSS